MEESRKRGREWAGYLLAVLALAAAYAIIGRLGLLLAIPPGYATAAWPPSGIALAALLLWGSRLWPGVLLGSMLVNLLTSGDFSTAESALRSALGATSIGLGAALQAMAGAYLIRRLVGYSNFLTQEVDVVRILALGGPVACVINATVGVTTLWLADLIPTSNYWFNWWTWWIGDSIGVLIFTPLCCIWTLRPARVWLRRQLAVTVPLATMFAAVVVVFFITSAREYERVEAEFTKGVDSYLADVRKRVDQNLLALHATKGLFDSSEDVRTSEFATFADHMIRQSPNLLGLGWNPRVDAAGRARFEAAMRALHGRFVVSERPPEGGELRPAAAREQHFPLAYIHPSVTHAPAIGYDVASDPVRRAALERARDSGEAAATAPLQLVQLERQDPAVIIFLPVYRGLAPNAGAGDRQRALRGFVSAPLLVSELVRRAAVDTLGPGIEYAVFDEAAGPGALYATANSAVFAADGGLRQAALLEVAGRLWRINFALPAAYLIAHRSWQAWSVMAAGLLFTGLVGIFLFVLVGRQSRVADELVERKRNDERFRAMVEAAPNALIMTNRAGEIVLTNQQAEKMFGYAAGELLGRKVECLVPQRLREQHGALRDGFAKESRGRMMGAGRDLHGVRKDGSQIPIEIGLNPLQTSEGKFVLAAIVDISERKRAEEAFRARVEREIASKTEALEASEQRYRGMAEAMPIAVFTATPDGTLDYLNETLIRYYGLSAQEMLNADWAQLTHPEDAVKLQRAFEGAMRSGEPLEVMGRERRHDGEYRWHITRALPLRDHDGRIIKWIGAMLDVEDLQQARAAAEAAMHAKANFLATMSHEIRTPLNATVSMSGMLLDTKLDNQQRDIAETIRTSGEQLLTIINDILDFSKIEAGKLELEKAPFDLRVCIEDALDLVSGQAASKGLELAYEYAPPTPHSLIGSADRVRQVLVNLLSNAVKFTERGEAVVHVKSRPIAGDSHEIQITVRDTGIGIEPQQIGHLFQAFSQADASTTRRFGGTGLGLAICKRLVEAMNGRIWVESEPGKGSQFHFTFQAQSAVRRNGDHIWTGGETGLRGCRLLIVDDNATNRRILRMQADAWGMSAVDFESPHAALAHARGAAPYDVALLDYMMPDMDGLTLARELRQLPALADTALIVLSSAMVDGQTVHASGADIQAVFLKPVRQSVLYNALMETLNGRPVPLDRRRARGRLALQAGATPAPHPSALRILVAEDNPVNQKVTRLLLARFGCRADYVGNGQEAVEAVLRQPYDVVLMDVMMPDMDGFQATREIRARVPAERQPRIIGVTALALEGDRERCLAAGMDDYLSKPIQSEQLAVALALPRAAPEPAGVTTAPAPDASAAAGGTEMERALQRMLADFGSEGATDMMKDIVADAPRLLEGMSGALAHNDARDLKLYAHTLKSMSQLVGASALSAEFLEIERLGSTGNVADASTRGAQALARYRELMAELASRCTIAQT